jgi:hypothetical protein
MRKAKAKRMPGKKRPAASRSLIQRPPTTEALHRNHRRNTQPEALSSRLNFNDSNHALPKHYAAR